MGVHVPPPSWTLLPLPSSPHHSGLSQSTSFEYPASCIELALVIYFTYGNIHGETVEIVSDFIFWGSKITSDGDYSHEIKRHLLLGRKVLTNPDSIFKSRDITLPTKVCLVKAMVFPVVCMHVRVGVWRKLSAEELMPLNCGVGEESWESLGLQGDPASSF